MKLLLRSFIFSVLLVLTLAKFEPFYSEKFNKTDLTKNMLELESAIGAQNLSLDTIVSKLGRSGPASWMPSIFKAMKSTLHYFDKSKGSVIAKVGPEGDLQNVVCLIALLAIASFLIFLFQPHPRYKRSQPRRIRGPSPYAYKTSPTYWGPPPKHSESESRPIILPGPLVPVAVPIPVHGNMDSVLMDTPAETEEEKSPEHQAQSSVKRPTTYRKTRGRATKPRKLDSEKSKPVKESDYEDKLTREEILYILKTLDD